MIQGPAVDWTAMYTILLGSDGEADGMFLEARERATDAVVLYAFYADQDGSLSFEPACPTMPPAFVAWFRAEAARRLPPATESDHPSASD